MIRRGKLLKIIHVIAALVLTVPIHAKQPWQAHQQEHTLTLKEFTFNSGVAFNHLKLHYLTLGTPKYNAAREVTNGIMLLHATVNDAQFFLQPDVGFYLFERNAPLDASRFFIIIPDGIGAGGSSKPSDGLHGQFPRFGYLDQIKAHKAVLDHEGVRHLKLLMGTSMGGMQTWLFGEQYPDFVDALIPIVSTARPVSGRDFIWREVIMRAITDDPRWQKGKYTQATAPTAWRQVAAPVSDIMLGTAELLEAATPTRAASLTKYEELVAALNNADASDWYSLLFSAYDYNPAPKLAAIKAQVCSINFKDDLLNPPEFILLPALPNFTLRMLPGGYGHITFAHPDLWINAVSDFLKDKQGWEYLNISPVYG